MLIAEAGAGFVSAGSPPDFGPAGEARLSLPMGSEGLSRLLGYGAADCYGPGIWHRNYLGGSAGSRTQVLPQPLLAFSERVETIQTLHHYRLVVWRSLRKC